MNTKLLLIILCLLAFKFCKADSATDAIALKTILWNNANNNASIDQLSELYESKVTGYGKYSKLSEFLERKAAFFEKYPEFKQSIISSLTITAYENEKFKCEFLKKANAPHPKTYPSYLIFTKTHDDYKIIEEGDEVTNANLNYFPVLGKALNVVTVESSITTKPDWLLISIIVLSFLGLVGMILYYFFKPKKKVINIPNYQMAQVASETITQVHEELITHMVPSPDKLKKMGDEFEAFVESLFNSSFSLVTHQSDTKSRITGRTAESNQDPDLIMRLNFSDGRFNYLAVECKYKSSIIKDQDVELCRPEQLQRYIEFGKSNNMPVFIVVGVGGKPTLPDEVYIISVLNLYSNIMSYREFKNYKRYSGNKIFWFTPNDVYPFQGTLQ